MSFRTWLVHLLGGYTKIESQEIINNYSEIDNFNYNRMKDYLDNQVNYLREQLQQERDNNKTLQDMIYVKFGITKGQAPTDNIRDEPMKPIGGRMSWTQRKAKLEADDIAAYWKKKQAENEASLREADNVG